MYFDFLIAFFHGVYELPTHPFKCTVNRAPMDGRCQFSDGAADFIRNAEAQASMQPVRLKLLLALDADLWNRNQHFLVPS